MKMNDLKENGRWVKIFPKKYHNTKSRRYKIKSRIKKIPFSTERVEIPRFEVYDDERKKSLSSRLKGWFKNPKLFK